MDNVLKQCLIDNKMTTHLANRIELIEFINDLSVIFSPPLSLSLSEQTVISSNAMISYGFTGDHSEIIQRQ